MKRPIYYILTLSYLFLQSFGSHLFAIDTVPTVWRADSREPNEIFEDGFRSRGTNNSLLEHTLGDSVSIRRADNSQRSSIFISTSGFTEEGKFIEKILSSIFSCRHPRQIWVYEINPDENFYNSEGSLRAFLRSPEGQSLSNEQKSEINGAIRIARRENEWVCVGRIPPRRIRGARRWSQTETGTWQRTETYRVNDRYDGKTLHSNRNPYLSILR